MGSGTLSEKKHCWLTQFTITHLQNAKVVIAVVIIKKKSTRNEGITTKNRSNKIYQSINLDYNLKL